MFSATHSTRRSFLRRSTLALVALAPLGSRLSQHVQATPNDGRKPRTIAVKANSFIDDCFRGGGEPEVGAVTSTAATVTCTDEGGWMSCTFTAGKPTRCIGSGDTAQAFSHIWHLEPLTGATDPLGLSNGGEVEFTLVDVPTGGRKRRRHRRRKH